MNREAQIWSAGHVERHTLVHKAAVIVLEGALGIQPKGALIEIELQREVQYTGDATRHGARK